MNSNILGTIFRIFIIFFALVFFWFSVVTLFYYLCSLFFGFEFSLFQASVLFGFFILFRMFYPKNVFV